MYMLSKLRLSHLTAFKYEAWDGLLVIGSVSLSKSGELICVEILHFTAAQNDNK